MNFLQLCQRLRQRAGIAGSGPSDVVGQAGELDLIVNLINSAWIDIQNNKKTWQFLWVQDYELTIVPDGGPYNVQNFNRFASRPTIDGYNWLSEWDYYAYKNAYDVTILGRGRPNRIIVQPNRTLAFDSNPIENHTVKFDYYRKPQSLLVKEDVPLLPEQHHMTIVWLALIRYAEGEEAPTLINTAEREYSKALASLQSEQLPTLQIQRVPFA